jgi:ribonuclease HI
MPSELVIFTDGSGENSHIGGRAAAITITDDKTPIEVKYREYKTPLTCNEAEYNAVILALEEQPRGQKIRILSDSQLIVNQLDPHKPWKINFEHLQLLNSFVRDIIKNLELDVEFVWIERDGNLAGKFLEGKLRVPPDIILTEND